MEQDAATVWALFRDIPELALCLPGAEITADRRDGSYAGKVSVRLGPTATFEGEASIASDLASRSGTVSGKGIDQSGGSAGYIKVHYSLESVEEGTRVEIDADVLLSGAAAQCGRTGLIKEMSSRLLIGEFASCVEAKLSANTAEGAAKISASDVQGFSWCLSNVISMIAKFVKNLSGVGRKKE